MCAVRATQALLQAALQAGRAPAPALPLAKLSASRPYACSGGSACAGDDSAASMPVGGTTGVVTSSARSTPGRPGISGGEGRVIALGRERGAAPVARPALAPAPRALPQPQAVPGPNRVSRDRGASLAAHPPLDLAAYAGTCRGALPAPGRAPVSPGGAASWRARRRGPVEHAPAALGWVHDGMHGHEPGHLGTAEAGAAGCPPRDARPAWDDTVALHAQPCRRAPSPDPGPGAARGPQAILAEALRKREALQRRVLTAPQGLTPRGHPGSMRLTWQQAHGAEAVAQPRCDQGMHSGLSRSRQAHARSEDTAGARWPSPVRCRQGLSPDPSLGAALRQLDALEARMAGLVGRVGVQLGGLEPCKEPCQGPSGSSPPPRPASAAPADADAQVIIGREERKQARAPALLACTAADPTSVAQAVSPDATAAASAAGTHDGVLGTGRTGLPPGSRERGLCSAACAERLQVRGADDLNGAAGLQAEAAKGVPEQEGCAGAGVVRFL